MTSVLTTNHPRLTPQPYQFTSEKLLSLIELVSICKEQIVVWLRLTDCHEYLMRTATEKGQRSKPLVTSTGSSSLASCWLQAESN